jgi:starvation-inducible DNA-binding protein
VESVSGHSTLHRPISSCHLRAVSEFGKAVRADIDASAAARDAGTADVFTEISRATDKQLWLVEAYLCGSR